jgi:mono/diheme cytochrome c family protein
VTLSKSLSIAAALAAAAFALAAQDAKPPAAAASEPTPAFDAAYLKDPANIEAGQAVWSTQCRHCHGASAYPGKAPKLNPGAMEPAFIFDRVTYGFGKMPAWKDVFSLEQRKAVVAYIKSDRFTP